ncbi:MAG: A24 family peptidase [Planctomycetota bacterium]|jgi:prepilin peptidase CpaA
MTVFRWGVVIGASLVASIGDVRERRIPNALTFPLLAVGLIWATWFGGFLGLAEAIGACLMLAVPYVFLFVFAGGGAGDAKLMGAIGTWLGLKHSVVVLLCVATAGVVLALFKAIAQRRLKLVLTSVLISCYTFMVCVAGGRRPRPAGERTDGPGQPGGSEVPYGVAICAGVCAAAAVVWMWGVEWLW